MVVTLGQQYDVGEKPPRHLYTLTTLIASMLVVLYLVILWVCFCLFSSSREDVDPILAYYILDYSSVMLCYNVCYILVIREQRIRNHYGRRSVQMHHHL